MAPSSDGVKSICFGNVEIEAWYKSQYPLEYSKSSTLYVCEFCLEYMKKEEIYNRHMVGVLFCMIWIIHLVIYAKYPRKITVITPVCGGAEEGVKKN